MSGRQIPILPIIVMCAIAAAAYGLYKNVSFVEEEIFVEQSDEARKNRLLAASRLLEKNGFTFDVAEDRFVFSDLDIETTGVLWLSDLHELTDQREAQQILDWIEQGGILLGSAGGDYAFNDASIVGWFMQQLGIQEIEGDDETGPELHDDLDSGIHTIELPDADLENPSIRLFSDFKPYFQTAAPLPDNIEPIIDSEYLIHSAMGNGFFAIYADYELFDTDKIDEHDQAYLLLWLTQPAKNKNVSIVFNPASKPGLFTVLWSRYTLAILLFGLVLIAFLRWAASRLGPVEHELPPIKNNIMAHLEARGEYWYRHKHTDEILASVQTAALDSLATSAGKRHSGFNDEPVDRAQAIKQASAQLQCSAATAEQALFSKAKNDSSLLRISQALQRLNHRKLFKLK